MINLQKLTSKDKLILSSVKKIYENSFPFNERRDFKNTIALLSDKRFQLSAILFENEIVGMLSKWDFDGFVYIEHFAIAKVFRGNGLGSFVLQEMIKKENRQIVLEVELPENNFSLKRIKFYERFGFHICHELYIQPPYDKEKKSVSMLIMTLQRIQSITEFNSIKSCIHKEVYGYFE
ncbi:MAG: GNAT family N-acetyltransferase [Bacteroidales bacterium]